LEEAALYDPDNETGEEDEEVVCDGPKETQFDEVQSNTSQIIPASSLWTIQEESEPDADA
jgi:hypothetical protein